MSTEKPILAVNAKGACARVTRSMHDEILRQVSAGLIDRADQLTESGHVRAAGVIDLAALAHVAELALRKEFGR